MTRMTVGDVMTRDVVSVPADTPFQELVRLLAEHRVSAVPVVDRERRVAGMVSEADLLQRQVRAGGPLTGTLWGSLWRMRFARRSDARTAGELMNAPAVTVVPETTVTAAAATLARCHVKRAAVVGPTGELVGVVSRKDLLSVYRRADAELAEQIRFDVLHKTLWLAPSEVTVDVHAGVVTLRGTVEQPGMIGLAGALAAAVDGVVEVRNEIVADTARGIMHHGVHTVALGDSVTEAARRMRAEGVGALLVHDAFGSAVGIVTDRDLAVKCAAAGADPGRTDIGSMLSAPLHTVDADATVTDVLTVMRQHHIRRIPVMADNRPIGIITEADVARRIPAAPAGRFLTRFYAVEAETSGRP